MTEECCAPNGNIMIPACSGASNVGQLSNQVAVELSQKDLARCSVWQALGPPQRLYPVR